MVNSYNLCKINITIGASAVIINNVSDNVTFVGNPGRIIKKL